MTFSSLDMYKFCWITSTSTSFSNMPFIRLSTSIIPTFLLMCCSSTATTFTFYVSKIFSFYTSFLFNINYAQSSLALDYVGQHFIDSALNCCAISHITRLSRPILKRISFIKALPTCFMLLHNISWRCSSTLLAHSQLKC